MKYQCPVCFYDDLPYPPADYHICLCCGTEFGNDDKDFSHAQLEGNVDCEWRSVVLPRAYLSHGTLGSSY